MLVTWLGSGNFGTSLQAYALSKKLNNLGYDCHFLNFFSLTSSLKDRVNNLFTYLGVFRGIKFLKSFRSTRERKVYKFNTQSYKHQYVANSAQYRKLLATTDVFLTGSDQIWNTAHKYKPFYFLDFAGENRRVAYASSIGMSYILQEHATAVKGYLDKFDYIGVRENTAVEVINQLTGRDDVRQVLDPTFLLTPNEWACVANEAVIEMELPKKYIFCYCVGARENYQTQLDQLKERLNIADVIFLPSREHRHFILNDTIVYREAAPREFIYLLQHAAYVCTDSFHALALSINLSKSFVAFLRFDSNEKRSQNSRVFDLLNHYHLIDRLYTTEHSVWATDIDYSPVQQILEADRDLSLAYLTHALDA